MDTGSIGVVLIGVGLNPSPEIRWTREKLERDSAVDAVPELILIAKIRVEDLSWFNYCRFEQVPDDVVEFVFRIVDCLVEGLLRRLSKDFVIAMIHGSITQERAEYIGKGRRGKAGPEEIEGAEVPHPSPSSGH